MSVLLLLIPVAVAIAAVLWWKLRRPADSTPASSLPRHAASGMPAARSPAVNPSAASARQAVVPVLSARASAALAEPMPPVLADFVLVRESALPAAQHEALMTVIGGIPRPPMSLHQLLAPDFFDRADSLMLSELLMGEPLIAAKVLATVNSPFYGLHQSVTSIEPAITFLGMDTVRNICVQYMLAQAFKPELRAAQRSFDTIWRSSA
ncbi:MAG: HDOD domain-containing protein, partial [Simplicispira sp.]|uniref:HDOD domain-containing protein n=1 Tax=Simplicispira sp. TaxID=2015802 RepID=UPI002585CC2C